MANTVNVQVLEDGPRNTVVKFTGELDASDETYGVKIDPASFPTSYPRPDTWRIDFLEFALSDGLEATLYWDASAPQVILPVAGRGNKHFKNFGGDSGMAAAAQPGWTGGIGLAVKALPGAAYTAGQPYTYAIYLDLVKQWLPQQTWTPPPPPPPPPPGNIRNVALHITGGGGGTINLNGLGLTSGTQYAITFGTDGSVKWGGTTVAGGTAATPYATITYANTQPMLGSVSGNYTLQNVGGNYVYTFYGTTTFVG